MADLEAAMLGPYRKLTGAAETGADTNVWEPAHTQQEQMMYVQTGTKPGGAYIGKTGRPTPGAPQPIMSWVPYNAAQVAPGGIYNKTGKVAIKPQTQTQLVQVPAGMQNVNFKGMGTQEVQNQLAMQMAQQELNIQKQYAPQQIAEETAQEAQAEPQQVAARQQEYNTLEKEVQTPFVQPVANALDPQIQAQLAAAQGHTLTAPLAGELSSGVAAAEAARGGGAANPAANFETPLTTGQAGYQSELSAIQAAMGELQTGSNPQDIQYRYGQQNMANLGAFANSQTPEAEFSNLSGAANGAVAFQPGQALPTENADTAGAQNAAIGGWQTQLQEAESQMNPWLAGLSGTLGIAGGVSSAATAGQAQTNYNNLLQTLQNL